jgi:hypothetical protein
VDTKPAISVGDTVLIKEGVFCPSHQGREGTVAEVGHLVVGVRFPDFPIVIDYSLREVTKRNDVRPLS